VQQIFFDKIEVDPSLQTLAKGKIVEETAFTLSPYFDYFGNVTLHANNEYLTFEGNTRIKHICNRVPISWLAFETEVNPMEIYIPLNDSSRNNVGGKVIAGIMQGVDSSAVYSSFVAPQSSYSDDTLVYANGQLYYDKNTKEYRVASMERIKENKYVGNYMSLNSYCDIYAEGEVGISSNLGRVEVDAYGNMINKTKTAEISANLVLSVDFYFSEAAFEIMEKVLAADLQAAPSNMNSEVYYKHLVHTLGDVQADQLISELSISGTIKKMPDALLHNMVFSDVNFVWDDMNNRYVSEGDVLSLVSLNETQLNRVYKGNIVIEKRRSGDIMDVYLEDGSGTWFFFHYRRGIMQVISSNKEFNTVITETKPEDRKLKGKRIEERYFYQISTEKRKKDFLKKLHPEEIEEY